MPTRFAMVLIFVFVAFAGCSSPQYRVVPNAPNPPRFIVLPFDHTPAQRAYANLIEQELLSFGFVVYAPGLGERDVEVRETGSGLPSGIGELTSRQPEGPATHVVQCFARTTDDTAQARFRSARLKIWELDSRRVIASFPVTPHAERHDIYEALKAEGLPVEQY